MGSSMNEREIAARTVQIRTGITLDEARAVAAKLGDRAPHRARVISDEMLDELVGQLDPNSLGV